MGSGYHETVQFDGLGQTIYFLQLPGVAEVFTPSPRFLSRRDPFAREARTRHRQRGMDASSNVETRGATGDKSPALLDCFLVAVLACCERQGIHRLLLRFFEVMRLSLGPMSGEQPLQKIYQIFARSLDPSERANDIQGQPPLNTRHNPFYSTASTG